jgi:hypothetical protein
MNRDDLRHALIDDHAGGDAIAGQPEGSSYRSSARVS